LCIPSALLLCLTSAACFNANEDELHDAQPDLALAGEPILQREIGSLTAAGVTLTFLADDGEEGRTSISLREHGSAYAKMSPVPELIGQSLTSAEIYLALAPEGSVVPPELLALQEDEAERLGRAPELRRVRIAAGESVEKDLQACRGKLFTDISSWGGSAKWMYESSGSYSGGLHNQYVNKSFAYATQSPVVLGACNESANQSVDVAYAYNQSWNNVNYVSPAYPLGAGGYYVWYFRFSVPASCVAKAGKCVGECINSTPGTEGICFPRSGHGASYLINADGPAAYDLMTAIWTNSITPPK
jgi:hypothetical protein